MARPTLSLVIPIFNEEPVIPELERRLSAVLGEIERTVDSWEVVFVDDGSKDRSFALLSESAQRESRYKVISFARNFGHQVAITAGVDRADGDAVVVMDADLQDPPEVIIRMIEKWREGFDVVYGVRQTRKGETAFKKISAAAFYRVFRSMLGGIDVPLDTGDFRLMSRRAVLALSALREQHRFVRGMVAWVGFRQTAVYYDRDARFAGETKYPLKKMLRFAADGITSFSVFPLRIATWLGVLAGAVALALGAWALYSKFFTTGVVTGWTTIMILVAFGSSTQLLMMGILGEYVGRIYEETKRRPLYITQQELNMSEFDSRRDASGVSIARVPSPDTGIKP
jgi:glycosyltransferase involved in cell wall biosynthesis